MLFITKLYRIETGWPKIEFIVVQKQVLDFYIYIYFLFLVV